MLSNWHNVLQRRDLVVALTVSELKTNQLQTRFGWFWWVLDPLLMMAVYWLLVVVIFGRGGGRYEPYPIFLLLALVSWKHLSAGVSRSTTILQSHQGVIKSVPFPTMVLPIAMVLSGFVLFLFAFAVVAGASLLSALPHHSGDVVPLLQLPPLMLCQVGIVTGVCLAVSCLGVMISDLQAAMEHVLRIAFYLSPGLYGLDLIEEAAHAHGGESLGPVLVFLYTLNPFAVLFAGYRDSVFYGQLLEPSRWLILGSETILCLIVGYRVFVHYDRRAVKLL